MARGTSGNAESAAMRAFVRWYRRTRRDLPWRAADDVRPDPYRVVVSEFMLQQTRVETVLRYYAPFLARFPDTAALAASGDAALRQSWQGMGYYRRASHLRGAARAVIARHGGIWPDDEGVLRTLPGFGPYTAAAVAAIAFGQRATAIDGNVLRVLSRLTGQTIGRRAEMTGRADALYRRAFRAAPPAVVAQAWMELGATVCTPRAPDCEQCPLSALCEARAAGDPASLDSGRRRGATVDVPIELLLIERRGRHLALLRPPGLLGGQWGWPTLSVERHGDMDIAGWATEAGGHACVAGSYVHVFSHRRWRVRVWRVEMPVDVAKSLPQGSAKWVTPERVPDLAMPRAMSKATVSIR